MSRYGPFDVVRQQKGLWDRRPCGFRKGGFTGSAGVGKIEALTGGREASGVNTNRRNPYQRGNYVNHCAAVGRDAESSEYSLEQQTHSIRVLQKVG